MVFSQPMGANQSIYYFSQLRAAKEDCLIDRIVRDIIRYAKQHWDSIYELRLHSRVKKMERSNMTTDVRLSLNTVVHLLSPKTKHRILLE